MSESIDSTVSLGLSIPEGAGNKVASVDDRPFDFAQLSRNPLFIPSIVLFVSLCLAFQSLWKTSFNEWFEPDSLYSHGPLIPFLSVYIVWVRWPRMKDIPVKPAYWTAIFLLPLMYVTWIGSRTDMKATLAILFLLTGLTSVWLLAGWRWMLAAVPIAAFMSFGFPLWTQLVDRYTLTMQHLSADMAVQILTLCGLHPLRTDPTTVFLDHFTLNVAAACSGAKLTLALSAFTAFFMLTRQARWFANAILVVILVPFCLFVNGIRIAMVGIVGNQFGDQAGRQFHDYGGYIALVICFILLNWITKALGYK